MIVIITLATLSLFTVAVFETNTTLVSTATNNRGEMHARLTADSAIEYVHRQLGIDADWNGTAGWVDLDDDSRFRVDILTAANGGEEVTFVIEAEADGAEVMLEPVYDLGAGTSSLTIDHALALLGGDADMNSVKVWGDMAVVDESDGVLDWNPVTELYEPMGGADPNIAANSVEVFGDLYTNTGSLSGASAESVNALESPLLNPHWSLDEYLVPAGDTQVYFGQHNFNGLNTNKTVVVVPDPGQNVHFENCEINGGVVIWTPAGWEPRGPARNSVTFNSCKFGMNSANSGRNFPFVGMIAPNCDIGDSGNSLDEGKGLFMFKGIERLNSAKIYGGALWATGDADVLNSVEIEFDPALREVTISGLLGGDDFPVVLKSVREYHPVTAS